MPEMSNLEQWLKTAEERKQEALLRISLVCKSQKEKEDAERDIELHHLGVMIELKRIKELHLKVNPDLSVINKYMRYPRYSIYSNHLAYHLSSINNIPTQIEEGKFIPKFVL